MIKGIGDIQHEHAHQHICLRVVWGLWVWESSGPLWTRLILVLGLGFATIYTFFPKQT